MATTTALLLAAVLVALPTVAATGATGAAAASDAPILLVVDPADPFSRYHTEILRAEGLNDFDVADVATLDDDALSEHVAVLLAATAVNDTQVAMLTNWVREGGNLIAMRPEARLAPLVGLGTKTGELGDAYLKIDTSAPPGQGIAGDSMQFHGVADRWTVTGADVVARLATGPDATPDDPAVTLRSVGDGGGQVAAFTFDLARSIVYTRQGNPAWAGQERDFALDSLRRSDDLFFGAKPGDMQPDWVNLDRIQVPQADEQQRLLANLLTEMSSDRMPLPRFWYLPRGLKAAVILTGDDHALGGTPARFNRLLAASPAGCSADDWSCPRMTSYVFPDTPMTDAQVAAYEAQGFEIGLHVNTACADFTPTTLLAAWNVQLPAAHTKWPSLAPIRTNRTHCIAWSDWATQPKVELGQGVRLDTNYYYWPASWVQNRPGMFTGSGFPMRFADLDGTIIDVYQATTQMTDESGIDYRLHIDTLLNNALGPKSYYGVFTANMHTDQSDHVGANTIVASAVAHQVPVIPAVRMLDWLDARNGSSFGPVAYSGGDLRFTISRATSADGLRAMIPVQGPRGPLVGVRRGTDGVPTTKQTIKGVEYAFFDAAAGDYTASYVHPSPTPTPTTTETPTPTPEEAGVPTAVPAEPTATPTLPRATAIPTVAPRPALQVGPSKVRASRQGAVQLRVSCAGCASSSQLQLRLRIGQREVASARVKVAPGVTKSIKLKLNAAAKRELVRKRRVVVIALATTVQGERTVSTRAMVRVEASR